MAALSDAEIAAISDYLESIGEGGIPPARLKQTDVRFVEAKIDIPPDPAVFDAQGDAKNCHYSVWTYGWYCGDFLDALAYHLKHQW